MPGDHPAKAAAFFDMDKTLIDVDAGFRFGHHLLELARIERDQATGRRRRQLAHGRRRLVAEVYGKAILYFPLYKLRVLKRSSLVRESYTFFAGQDADELRVALDNFYRRVLRYRVYPEVQRVLEWHARQGHETVLITTGPQLIADRYAKDLGIRHAYGVTLVEEDGFLNGRAVGPMYGADKAELAAALAETYGWDLRDCYAYTDHDSDRALLELVGHPHPVHPNARLARLARAKGWRVLDFRDPGRSVPEDRSVVG